MVVHKSKGLYLTLGTSLVSGRMETRYSGMPLCIFQLLQRLQATFTEFVEVWFLKVWC